MNQTLILKTPPQTNKLNDSFTQELIRQIRLADTLGKYTNWSDEILVAQLIISLEDEENSSKNLNLDPLNQLLTNAFYQAIGATIEQKSRHPTETYVHLRNKEFSSAVITCGGVLVLYSLIWGYRSFGFVSLAELIESANTDITNAITKASHYLNF
ncbi:MAG: DUF269 domain-containing protein [Cyanobacteria bacterium P01_E01_bin.35]